MTNLIQERDERTRKRKRKKRKMDSIIGLSSGNLVDKETGEVMNTMKMSAGTSSLSGNTIRLLDEGYCDQGFVIKKGTLEKYLNGENQYVRGYEMGEDGEWQTTDVLNLTDDFVGTGNVGHQEFATYPIIVDRWGRENLSLVDIENDRKGIDIAVNINEDLNVIQDLKAMPYDIGVSAEFYYHINDADTEALFETFGEYIPVIDEIFIFAYGLVGECGNVNSSGLELKGATMSKPIEKQMAMEEVDVNIEVEGTEEAIEEIEAIDEAIEEEAEAVEEPTEEAEEPAEEEQEEQEEEPADEDVSEEPTPEEGELSAEDPEEEEEGKEGEVDDVDEEIDNEDEAEEAELSFDELLEQFTALKDEVERLKDIEAKYVALKKSHRRVNRKLAEEKEAKAEFFAKTKGLSAELFENEGEAEKEEEAEAKRLASEKKYYKGDGIAD